MPFFTRNPGKLQFLVGVVLALMCQFGCCTVRGRFAEMLELVRGHSLIAVKESERLQSRTPQIC